jgi:hypothetical protein
MGFQQGTQAAAHHFMIVSDQYAERGHADLQGPNIFLQFAVLLDSWQREYETGIETLCHSAKSNTHEVTAT